MTARRLAAVVVAAALCVLVGPAAAEGAVVAVAPAAPALVVASSVVAAPVPPAQEPELPTVNELPSLPNGGYDDDGVETVDDDDDVVGFLAVSTVQLIAMLLALAVLVAGGIGLYLVTRRGRPEPESDPGSEHSARHEVPAGR